MPDMSLGWIMGVFCQWDCNKSLKTCRSRKTLASYILRNLKIREKGKSESENWFLALPLSSFCFVDE